MIQFDSYFFNRIMIFTYQPVINFILHYTQMLK